jgi:SAM-dependent methyltransferase
MAITKYIHSEQIHQLHSPSILVPILISFFSPKSVIDIGCGTGNFLRAFKDNGISEIKGLDGSWVNKNILFKNIEPVEFDTADLEKLTHSERKYDLALCLEVAEHLSFEAADDFISAICTYSDIIIFSAAIPGQGGQNHINEQWPTYWKQKFNKNQYVLHDMVRPAIWDLSEVDYWYKQNLLVFIKSDLSDNYQNPNINRNLIIQNIVHPDIFLYKAQLLDTILEGRYTFKGYMKMMLKYFRLINRKDKFRNN